jgi:hypothetical protein
MLEDVVGAKAGRLNGQATILDDDGRDDPVLPILAVPFTIVAPGRYALLESVATILAAGAAIRIDADNVDLDLRGFTIRNSAGSTNQALGVASSQHKNVSVRNGTLAGFFTGVLLEQAGPYALPQGHAVRKLQVLDSTYTGIRVEGRGDVVAECEVVGTGGPYADAVGIAAAGPGLRLFRNSVVRSHGAGAGGNVAIAVANADGALVSRNRLVNASRGASTGVLAEASTGVTVENNRLANLDFGVVFPSPATGSMAGNTFANVPTPYLGP